MRILMGLLLPLATLAVGSSAQADTTQSSESACPHDIWWLPCIVNTEKSDEIEQLLAEELYVGAPSSEIEAFFERHEITYSYNRFGNRYQAIIRDVSSEPYAVQSVVIRVNLDDQNRYVTSEVGDEFSFRNVPTQPRPD